MEGNHNRLHSHSSSIVNPITKDIIIIGVFLLFLISFINIYPSITLLWGNTGLLPANELLKANTSLFPSIAPFLIINTSLLTVELFLYLTCITGIFLSFISILYKPMRNWITMLFTWGCYLNLFLLGQQFMSFEYDYLLLEIGFNAILLCDTFYINNSFLCSYGIYLMQFITFKQLFGTGITMIQSKQRQWLNFTWIEGLCEKQFFPTMLTYYVNFYMPYILKKSFAVIGMTIMIIVPFGQFLGLRRIILFVGQVIFLFHFCMIFIGNYGMVNIMCIVINIANFNDDFMMVLYNAFQLEEKMKNNKKKNHNEDNKVKEDDEDNKKNQEDDNTDITGQNARKFLKDIHRHYYDNNNNTEDNNDSTWGLFEEIFVFLIMFFIFFVIIFCFIFPIKSIIINNTQGLRSDLFSQTTLNYWMIYIIIYIIISVIYEHLPTFISFSPNIKPRYKPISKFLFITLTIILYLLHSMNILYSGIGMSIATKQKNNYFYSLIDSSYSFFNKLHCSSSYNLFKDISFNDYGRQELSFKYLMINESEWNELKFYYRPELNETNGNLVMLPNPFSQPRLEWAIERISYSESINDEHVWLVSLLGRLFERNEALWKIIGRDSDIPRKEIWKVKVEKYVAFLQWNATNAFMKKFNKDFIGNIKRYALYDVIEKYHLPKITEYEKNDNKTTIIKVLYDIPISSIAITLLMIGISIKIALKYIYITNN